MKNNKKALRFLLILTSLALLLLILPAASAETEPCTQHVRTKQVTTEPTCTEPGYYIGVCAICGTPLDNGDVIPALGHDYQETVVEQPTCVEPGWGAQICTRCNGWLDNGYEIPALGHDFQEQITRQPTCTEPGWAVETCSRCGAGKDNGHEIPALGHAWDGGTVTTAATCTAAGVKTYTCTRCGVTTTEAIPALGHSPVTVPGKAATCTAAGLTEGSKCSVCGETLTAQTEIPALGHSMDAGVITTQATCTTAGVKTYTCTRCGLTATESIPATGHSPVTVPGKAATCTETGLTEGSKCSACGAVLTAQTAIPALGHDYQLTASKEATATEDGYRTYTCSRCGDSYTEIISKVPHDHAYAVVSETPATCTTDGIRTYACTICGAAYSETIPATGHNWGDWLVIKEATATEDGQAMRTCKNDASHVEYYTIPATGEPAEEAKPALKLAMLLVPKKEVYDVDETFGYEIEITNTGNVPLRFYFSIIIGDNSYDYMQITSHDVKQVFSGTVDPDVSKMVPESQVEISFSVKGEDIIPDPEDSPYAGTYRQTWKVYGYAIDDTEYTTPICESNTLVYDFKVAKPEEDDGKPHPAISVKTSADPDAGVGKRYEGALVPEHYEATNTGNCPVYVRSWPEFNPGKEYRDIIAPNGITYEAHMNDGRGVALLNPGETYSMNTDYSVCASEADRGYFELTAYEAAWYYDENGDIQYMQANSNNGKVKLTYPDDVTPEPDKPGLTLTYLGDVDWNIIPYPSDQDTFDADDEVFAHGIFVNSGNVPLRVVSYGKAEGVDDDFCSEGYLAPGESGKRGWGGSLIGGIVTPGTETEDLLGTATVSWYVVGYDPDTYVDRFNPGTELCRSETITRTWKVRKPSTDPGGWEIPELSKLEVKIIEFSSRSDPAGYQLNEVWFAQIYVNNIGPVDVDDFTLHVDYTAADQRQVSTYWTSEGPNWYEFKYSSYFTSAFSPDEILYGQALAPFGYITAEDVARGYVETSAYVTWTDPDSGKEKQTPTVTLTLPVISKTGLLVKKGIEHGPANDSYFQEGEDIPWTLTVTNNSNEPISNVTVTDEGAVVGTFAVINAGETVQCAVPTHTVTEYEAKVSGHVSNQAFAKGTDIKGTELTWPSNPVDVPTSSWSPVPLPHITDPGTGDPDPGPGDPGPLPPGTPETPETPGTPGGGPDPVGEILGVKVSTSVYKTTAHLPKNYDYYEEGEQADYKVTIKNTGETALENVKVYDSLHGLTPVETIPSLAPNEERTVSFHYIVSKDDVEVRGYVVNQVTITYDFLGMHGTPQKSNPVYIIAGENGHLPGGITGGIDSTGITGGTGSEDPLHPWFPGLSGLHSDGGLTGGGTTGGITSGGTADGGSGTGGAKYCSLTLNAMADSESLYTLHACADHSEAAKQAETASPAEAAAIWREEINKLYDTLYEAGVAEAQAAVMNDKIAFEAYADAYGTLYGDKALADLLRLRCAELCCMIHTAPDALPDSLLGSYASMLAGGSYDLSERIIGALKGNDSDVTIHMNGLLADAMAETKEIVFGTKLYAADESFGQARSTWQRALDKAVNAKYKAADRDGKKTLAAWRQALDQMYTARKELLELLYSTNDDTAQECLMNLYKDASIDATSTN